MVAAGQLPHNALSRVAEQEGLRTSDLLNMAIDSNGIMWLASQAYVQQFDGRQKRHYSFDETVRQVFVDRHNRKWIITRNNVYRIHPGSQQPLNVYTDSIRSSLIESLFEANDGHLYLIRGNTSLQYDSRKDEFISRSFWKFSPGSPVRYFTQSGTLQYLAVNDSIIVVNASRQRVASWFLGSKLGLIDAGHGWIMVPSADFKTRILNTRDGKVKVLKTPVMNTGEKPSDFLVFYAVPFHKSKMLLSTNKGLFFWDTDHRELSLPSFYYNGEPLNNPSLARYLYRSSDGAVYICHADGIFSCYPGQPAIQYIKTVITNGNDLTESDVRSFAEDETGAVWMATPQGMAKYHFSTGDKKVYPPFSGNNPIEYPSYRMLLNDGENMWIGTAGNGVWVLHKPTGRYSRPLPEPGANQREALQALFESTYVWKLVMLQNGKLMVAGGGRSFLIDPNRMTYTRIEQPWAGQSARSAIQDSSGFIWYGSTRGLWYIQNNLQPLANLKDSFPDGRIAALCEWRRNCILAGSKGLFEIVVQNGRVVAFSRIISIPAERFIYCMVKDKGGLVWLGTDDGIYRYDPQTQYAERFGPEDFVQPQAFNSNAAFVSSAGLVIMGGRAGINYFNPEGIGKRTLKLNPFLSSFRFGNNDSSWLGREEFTIPYTDENIDFTISAPQYINPYGIQYRYRLHKDDTRWFENGNNNRVRIHNLPPGHYTLQVSASAAKGDWNNSTQLLSFTVAKPWWQTLGFRLLILAIIAGMVYGIMYFRRKKRKQAEIQNVLNYFMHSGSAHTSTHDILWDIARNCIARLGFEDCVIYLLDESRDVLVQKAAFGGKSTGDFRIINPIEIQSGEGITGYAAKHGVSVRVGNTSKDNRYIKDDENRLSELAVPIFHEGKVIGVIDSEHRRMNFFTAEHQQTLEQIAAICSTKIAGGIAREAMFEAERKLELLNNRFTEAQFTNLRLQMNPHFLFNTLTSIQYLVVSGQTTNATRYLNIFSTFLRDLLQYAEQNIVALADELRILKNYIALESLTMDESFNYTIEAEESVDKEETLIPFMILQPFVENAIQHGLVHLAGEKKFSVQLLNVDDDFLRCIIEDNGIGRQHAKAIRDAKLAAGRYQSKGIDIVRKRLDLLYQRTGKKGNLLYEDLYDQQGKSCGTRVVLEIPYYQKQEL